MTFEKDKSEYVRNTFNSIAGRYDLLNSIMSIGMDRSWRRKAVQAVKAVPGSNILDVCCGTGKLTREIAKAVSPNGCVTGIDFSEKMLSLARAKQFPEYKIIEFIQGDALNLPFEDNTFDGATVGWGLRNLPDLYRGIREMVRVIKPGCMVVSLDMGKPSWPVFKQLYWLYFEKTVPWLGRIWSKEKEYRYLYTSAFSFQSQVELAAIFQECGLVNTGYINLLGGVVALVFGQKPSSFRLSQGNERSELP